MKHVKFSTDCDDKGLVGVRFRTRVKLPTGFTFPFLLAACGGGSDETVISTQGPTPEPLPTPSPSVGLPLDYEPPQSIFTFPTSPDPFSFQVTTGTIEPYWVNALKSEGFEQLSVGLELYNRTVEFAFPEVLPAYFQNLPEARGWQPANPEVRAAYREIFSELETILDVSFRETQSVNDFNVIAISLGQPPISTTAGYAFYPSATSFLGSDIVISSRYSDPQIYGTGLTNFDYEVLVHELGHALGLKHPFEEETYNPTTLSRVEDNSHWTVMTYDFDPSAYNGDFRAFDLLALVEEYGVNPSYHAGNDTYLFSSESTIFVIDGGGNDTIDASNEVFATFIDLRENQKSYLGSEPNFVSSGRQIVISMHSEIENVTGGSADDWIIGNNSANTLNGAAGDDQIFGGDGADVIEGGTGNDTIDLSELDASRDTVVVDLSRSGEGLDQIYSFVQGAAGDVIEFLDDTFLGVLDVVSSQSVPLAELHGYIVRLTDAEIDTAAQLRTSFSDDNLFSNLSFAPGGEAIVITADSQDTGEDQQLFYIQQSLTELDVVHLATFRGNYLDIDSWHANNFV